MRKKGATAGHRIGAISEKYGIHPQTLRMYEREGLLRPTRTEGNTRVYDPDTVERLEIILSFSVSGRTVFVLRFSPPVAGAGTRIPGLCEEGP